MTAMPPVLAVIDYFQSRSPVICDEVPGFGRSAISAVGRVRATEKIDKSFAEISNIKPVAGRERSRTDRFCVVQCPDFQPVAALFVHNRKLSKFNGLNIGNTPIGKRNGR